MLILGCGNPARGDDAAGALVVERLRSLGVEAQVFEGHGIDLLETWGVSDNVVVIDAMVSGGEPGAVRTWEDPARSMDGASTLCSTHGFGIYEAVRLGVLLGRLPARLTIYGIEATQFEPNAAPTPAVAAAAVALADRIAATATS